MCGFSAALVNADDYQLLAVEWMYTLAYFSPVARPILHIVNPEMFTIASFFEWNAFT